MLKVLIACEESQRVATEFRKLGHEAYSCDVIDCSGGHPEWHIKQDVIPLLGGGTFVTEDGNEHTVDRWDLEICHPPCIYLTVAANKLYLVERYGEKAIERQKKREEAKKFFMEFVNADCDHIAIENPIGVMSTSYRKPDQIIQPYQFGHPVRKSTCLWLKGLPKLIPTEIVEPELIHSKGKSGGYSGPSWVVKDENGKILSYKDPRVSKIRSKTYEGIAKAIASQWSEYLEKET